MYTIFSMTRNILCQLIIIVSFEHSGRYIQETNEEKKSNWWINEPISVMNVKNTKYSFDFGEILTQTI